VQFPCGAISMGAISMGAISMGAKSLGAKSPMGAKSRYGICCGLAER